MNAATITALITGITGLIGAVTTLVIVIVHVIRHEPIPNDNPTNSTVKPNVITPVNDGKQHG